jgi:hypothetical protein
MNLQLSSSIYFFGCIAWLCGTFAQMSSGQEKITLQYNMAKGDTRKLNFAVNMDNKVTVGDNTIDMVITMGMDATFAVKEVDKEGLHTVDFTYDRIKMKMTGPLEVDYDSDNKDEDPGPLAKSFAGLAGQTITMKIDRQAKVKDVQGFEKIAERMGVPKKQFDSQRDQMMQMIAPLPGKPVGIGDSWEGTMKLSGDPNLPITLTATYTLADRKDGDAIINLTGKLASDKGLTGTLSGTMRVEEKTGWTKSGNVGMSMKGDVQGVKMTMTAKTKFGPPPMHK